ncbi:OTU domain-containing protein 5-like [Chenopodium quinoa]|uniref:OTU domain-containing protein 5-like n=1 Tax=Chenopodium quinoa TaxID=63459 RepID=UPI000B77F684|nr:OTU domain-containing protein 5-like [Chenopodium quinoa]XP_021720525.1 OTU domain-containing protein 5-like [Chenopodium quinoa]XP_021720526.1 OTU domain-containing protein 5-like [Chenopodium quinoa]
MTRILVQRGSSSNQTRSSSQTAPNHVVAVPDEQVIVNDLPETGIADESFDQTRSVGDDAADNLITGNDENQVDLMRGSSGLDVADPDAYENDDFPADTFQTGTQTQSSQPPPPPIPPPKPSGSSPVFRRFVSGTSDSPRIGPSRRPSAWPVPTRTTPSASRPSSPRSHCESEGYNSADEQTPTFGSSFYDLERERQFEIDIRRAKGLEVKRMLEDGNCLFRAVADQVYGDSEAYDLTRQMCIDYMEREEDHFSQFIIEGFTSYCKRKRKDKVYGNNAEIQALSEMYNRPIHIYSYSTEPINIFHGNYDTDVPPIRLSYHNGNHYNSLVDPCRLSVGAGLGFSCLRGRNVDKDQVKAAIKAQQDQQLDNALLAEGRFYSDLELTEKEIERMVMEASRAEYLAGNKSKQHVGHRESSTSSAEPSSSGARPPDGENEKESGSPDTMLSSSMQVVLSMGFGYLQVIEAYNIFGDDVDSMVCYLLETSSSSRRKGKATE